MLLPLALALAAAPPPPPERLRMLMLAREVPVGVVEAKREGTWWTYRSTHLYRNGPKERRVALDVDASGKTKKGRVPETLWLSRLRGVGCVDVVEELELVPEKVCVTVQRVEGRVTAVTGTIGEAAFRARYGAEGALDELTVNEVTFRASEAALPDIADPFSRGFPILGCGPEAGRLEFVTVAHQSSSHGEEVVFRACRGDDPEPDEGMRRALCAIREITPKPDGLEPASNSDCLSAARAEVKSTPGLKVVLGIVTEEGRAWPHAWIEESGGHAIDPTLPPGDPRLVARHYVAFPVEPGRLYLALLAGAAQVRWVCTIERLH